ncbi:MAG TPA: hypothetical protein VK540_23775 [Polyangiaceae bacterium]|nr:hypothetical protein [Polyangiaceae bacterium]
MVVESQPSPHRSATKRPGVYYAVTADGSELPVVDVTNPAFAPLHDEAQMARLLALFTRFERWRARIPKSIMGVMLGWAARRSRLARAFSHASEGVVSGMTLYAAKLGPGMLDNRDWSVIDRRIAATPPSWLSRARLEDMARLLAEGLAPLLTAHPGRPLHLFNIAGGPAADSWNALLVLHQETPARLGGRAIFIHVLDLDEEGPAFGARAFAALRGEGAPLRDLDLHFRRVAYDWRDAAELRRAFDERSAADAVVAVSSEGGLFEYGSDEEIVANLEAIRDAAPIDSVVVGSVTRAEGPLEFLRQFTVRPRTLAAFRDLASRADWSIARVIERPLSYNVRLARRR